MRLLVTGATGFVGSHVVRKLHRRGHWIRALVRDPKRTEPIRDCIVEWIQGDLASPRALASACAGVEGVVHLAGLTKALSPGQFARVNAEGCARLAEAAAEASGPARFLLVSSLAAAGPCLDGSPLGEAHLPAPVSAYGRSKLDGERAAAAALEGTSVSLTVVRPPIV
jgi:nucleoside-diphosphate-sugar epimerase